MRSAEIWGMSPSKVLFSQVQNQHSADWCQMKNKINKKAREKLFNPQTQSEIDYFHFLSHVNFVESCICGFVSEDRGRETRFVDLQSTDQILFNLSRVEFQFYFLLLLTIFFFSLSLSSQSLNLNSPYDKNLMRIMPTTNETKQTE